MKSFEKQNSEIKREKWKTLKQLRKNGVYGILVYDQATTKMKYRKRWFRDKIFRK